MGGAPLGCNWLTLAGPLCPFASVSGLAKQNGGRLLDLKQAATRHGLNPKSSTDTYSNISFNENRMLKDLNLLFLILIFNLVYILALLCTVDHLNERKCR